MNDFETIFKYASVGIALVSETGHILKANPAFLTFLQTTEKDLYGTNFVDITHPDDIEKDLSLFEQLKKGEIPSYRIEKRYKIDGHYIWGLLTVARTDNTDYVVAQVQDINELKTAQEELKNFAYAASHDLREPLRIINGYAYMIQSTAQSLPPTLNYYLNNITEASVRMSEMIEGLLCYSRINQDKNYSKFDIRDACKQAQNNLAKTIEENLAQITIKGNKEVRGVKGQFVQLFQNIIDNAIKYKHEDRNPKIEINIDTKSIATSFSIKDNGQGIASDCYDKVFQIFKQLHASDKYPGRGIGMALVKQIVDNHHGKVWVESKVGEGTTFFVNIPEKTN